MLIITILAALLLVAIGYLAYQYTNCLTDIAKLEASLEDKETIASALKTHVKKLESDLEHFQTLSKSLKSELQSCTDKAKAAKAKAAKSTQAPIVVESKPKKRTYNKKSK